MKNPILSSAFTVLLFWWVVLTLGDGAFGEIELDQIVFNLVFVAAGVVLGGAAMAMFGHLNRAALETRLSGKTLRGLSVTMGMVPILKREPKRTGDLPNVRRLNIAEIENPDFLDQWRERWKPTHPHHVALVDAILRVLSTKPNAPATHLKDGHGGRTLLQHTLLTAFLMDKMSKTWVWEGNRSKGRNKQILIPLRNANYRWNADDPLIMVAAVGHDIGKLECYIYDKSGNIIGSRHEHDIASSQMIARISEAWLLPDPDREALLLSVGHYHHVPDIPMENKHRPLDDRLMALTELLIYCDTISSRLELGKPLVEAQAEIEAPGVPSEAKQDTLLTIFSDIVGETDRINGDDTRYRVGQKNTLGGKHYLLFHERSLAAEIAERSGLDAMAKMGNGEFRLTRELLTALDEKGVLYKKHDGKEYGAVSALWKVEFRKKSGDFLANWPATIIVEITKDFLPALLDLDDSDVVPLIKGPVHGEQRAKKGGNTGLDLESLSTLDAEKLLAAAALQPGTAKPAKKAPAAPNAPAASASGNAPADPAVAEVSEAPAAAEGEEVPDWAREDAEVEPPPTAPPMANESVQPDPMDSPAETGDLPTEADPEPTADPVPARVPDDLAGMADRASSEAANVCEQIIAGELRKAVPHPEEKGVFVVRANLLTPLMRNFSWIDSIPAINAGLVPGVRCESEGEGEEEVLFLLFNLHTVVANQQAATAFDQSGDMPIVDKSPGGDPW